MPSILRLPDVMSSGICNRAWSCLTTQSAHFWWQRGGLRHDGAQHRASRPPSAGGAGPHRENRLEVGVPVPAHRQYGRGPRLTRDHRHRQQVAAICVVGPINRGKLSHWRQTEPGHRHRAALPRVAQPGPGDPKVSTAGRPHRQGGGNRSRRGTPTPAGRRGIGPRGDVRSPGDGSEFPDSDISGFPYPPAGRDGGAPDSAGAWRTSGRARSPAVVRSQIRQVSKIRFRNQGPEDIPEGHPRRTPRPGRETGCR